MLGGRIPFVALPSVHWEGGMQTLHVFIAIRLSQHGCCCNTQILAITLDYGLVRNILIRLKAIPIDDDKPRFAIQGIQGPVHGLNRGTQNIDLVDLVLVHKGNTITERLSLNDGSQHFSPSLGELFRVVQKIIGKALRQDHSGRHNRSGQTTSSGFVSSCFQVGI